MRAVGFVVAVGLIWAVLAVLDSSTPRVVFRPSAGANPVVSAATPGMNRFGGFR
jgi:hypothetical protein